MRKTYTFNEVLTASLNYFKGDDLAAGVFSDKYALKNKDGDYIELTPTDMHRRLAREFARIETKYPNPLTERKIFELLSDWKIVPQGSPMAGIGNETQIQSLSNCFVIESPQDSYGGILRADQEQAQIMKRRGGVGFDISNIRPRGLQTSNAARTTDGIGVFMERFSNTCREVAQNGRRGALMLTVDVHHPEIRTFIKIKNDKSKVTGANISIRLSDEFMEAVESGGKLNLRFPVDKSCDNHLINEFVDAREIWNEIIKSAWESAEPGLLFWDTITKLCPADAYAKQGFKTVSTNPCVTGDTLIAVADGRNSVPISQLAKEGADVAVYSTNVKTGQVEIKMGRNPRLTKKNAEIWLLTLDDGSTLRATPDHRVLTRDFRYVELQNLQPGDSIFPFNADERTAVSVEQCGTADVYNITVDDNHNYHVITSSEDDNSVVSSGICVKNCGEITISPNDSCRLMLVNLFKFVKDPFGPNARFDYDEFNKTVQIAQRLMDDLVDLEIESIERIIQKVESDPETDEVKRVEIDLWKKIKKMAIKGRRTGLGITGLGDALAALNLTYGSDRSILETGKIYRGLALGAYRSTVQLAKERGSFPIYDHKLEENHPFIQRILNEDPELRKEYDKFGRRNIALTTTAPAGSVSILTQTTSGIECAFMLVYDRFKKIVDDHSDSQEVDRIDEMGDKWKKYRVYHHGLKLWAEKTGKNIDDIESSPYWKSTSADIDWSKKIELQAAAQKWICHSISNTTNIPKDTPIEVVKDIYSKGWKLGCKGVTIYREGSREGVLLNIDDNTDKTETRKENHASKRQKELKCDIHRASVKGEKYVVLVGKSDDDRPYEIFAGLSKQIEIPKKAKSGTLIKNGKSTGVATYNLKIPVGSDDELLLKDIVTIFDNPLHGALTRMLSLTLRHNVPINYIVEQLRKDKHSNITDFSKVIARILSKHYVPDGTSATTFEKKCSNCSSNLLSYQSGCVTCMNCGHSKCN